MGTACSLLLVFIAYNNIIDMNMTHCLIVTCNGYLQTGNPVIYEGLATARQPGL